jgi:hypothetical protein
MEGVLDVVQVRGAGLILWVGNRVDTCWLDSFGLAEPPVVELPDDEPVELELPTREPMRPRDPLTGACKSHGKGRNLGRQARYRTSWKRSRTCQRRRCT